MEAIILDRTDYTEAEYIAMFHQFERKIEYHDGRIEMMAGALAPHNDITMNVTLALGKNQRKCKPHGSDQAISVPKFKRYIYPDLSFSCGGDEYDGKKRRFLVNPALIVEVVSESSEQRDKENKFSWYFSLPSVKEYIIISSLDYDVRSYYRTDAHTCTMQSHWAKEHVLTVETLGETISLAEIYEDVVFLKDLDNQ